MSYIKIHVRSIKYWDEFLQKLWGKKRSCLVQFMLVFWAKIRSRTGRHINDLFMHGNVDFPQCSNWKRSQKSGEKKKPDKHMIFSVIFRDENVWTVHHIGPDWNIPTTVGWTVVKCGADVHGPLRMNSNHSVDSMTPLAPPSRRHVHLSNSLVYNWLPAKLTLPSAFRFTLFRSAC